MKRFLFILLIIILLLLLFLFVRYCKQQPAVADEESFEIPSIEPPRPDVRIPAQINPDLLPAGSRARLPAFDGDNFFVALDVTQADTVTADQVATDIIQPVLDAIGFSRGLDALRMPPANGVALSRPDFDGVIASVLSEAEENPKAQGPKTQRMLDVFSGETPADDEVNAALETGEGMDFSQFVAGIERQEILFAFTQIHEGTPIEHTSITASRWEQQGVTAVWGALVNNYQVTNSVALQGEELLQRGLDALRKMRGIECLDARLRERLQGQLKRQAAAANERATSMVGAAYGDKACGLVEAGPVLILLPYGADASGVIQLRYSYRMVIRIGYTTPHGQKLPAVFQVWHDAQTGEVLKLISLTHFVGARGEAFIRAPNVGTAVRSFQVDPASGGQYNLELTDMIDRVDFQADGYNASDVSIPDDTNGSSATLANFDHAPINDETEVICDSGTNKAFQQVNVFAGLYRYTTEAHALGVFMPFPRIGQFIVDVEDSSFCNAFNGGDVLGFGACNGYFDAACPNLTGVDLTDRRINPAHDNTVVAHEHAHSLTPRFTNARPDDWCDAPPCEVPAGWSRFHDLADFWADHFESTNCTGGWYAKNQDGVDNSLDCANSSEAGAFPRAHQLSESFDPDDPLDHFPEHRDFGTGGYANMQMPTAALWQVRLGMRSKCRWSGTPQFAVRYARALKRTGFFGPDVPGGNDLGLYRYLHDLEEKMLYEWTTAGSPDGPPAFRHNGPHTTNKLMAGFARAGLFMIPYQCVDSSAATNDPSACPGGTNGADAVIDIDDNDMEDDYFIHDVRHKEVDFLEIGGPAPTFQVWTGVRYQFDDTGTRSYPNPSLCNPEFQVEVSTDPDFLPAATISSGWQGVDRDPSTVDSVECYGTWTPSAADWTTLQAGGVMSRIHYRATTRETGGGNERISTEPGAGLYTDVPAPYAVLTADGLSDY